MDFQIKSANKLSRGFSLVEIILVIGIMSLFTMISTSVYSSFKNHENLEIVTNGVVEAIRHAQANAQNGRGDSDWGVEILSDSVVIFKGANYLSREASADQSLNFTGGVVASGLSEIVFVKVGGSTVDTGTITLANSYGTKNILINEKGTLTY